MAHNGRNYVGRLLHEITMNENNLNFKKDANAP